MTKEEAQKFADENGIKLFEVSAKLDKDSEEMDAIFIELANEILVR